MEEVNHRKNLENIYNANKDKVRNLRMLIESIDKVEETISHKIYRHQKYIENLKITFKQSIDSYHTICKNFEPQSLEI